MNLPDVSLVTHIKDPAVWDTWSIDLCQRLGFDENKHSTGPIIWAAGRIIGNDSSLKEYTRRIYGRCITKDYDELEVLAKENLRLCLERDDAQAERKNQLGVLQQAKIDNAALTEQLEAKCEAIHQDIASLAADWQLRSSLAVSVEHLEMLLQQAVTAASPSVGLRKLMTFVSRVYQQGAAAVALSALYADPDTAKGLCDWLAYDAPSPLLLLQRDDAATKQILCAIKRAREDLSAHSTVPSGDLPEIEAVLLAWCGAVQSLLEWPAIAKLADSLDSEKILSTQHDSVLLKQTDLQIQISEIQIEIAANADAYDVQYSASCNLNMNQLRECTCSSLADAVFNELDTNGSGLLNKATVESSEVCADLLKHWRRQGFEDLSQDDITMKDFNDLIASMCKSIGESECINCLARIVLEGRLTVVRD